MDWIMHMHPNIEMGSYESSDFLKALWAVNSIRMRLIPSYAYLIIPEESLGCN
jgi:hypothetical protein